MRVNLLIIERHSSLTEEENPQSSEGAVRVIDETTTSEEKYMM